MTGSGPAGVPAAVLGGVVQALGQQLGSEPDVHGGRGLGGGCIHNALTLETSQGRFFVKWNRGDAGGAFQAEARGLQALRDAVEPSGLVQVPEVLGAQDAQGDVGWLLLEYLPPSPAPAGYDELLGQGLAALHGTVGDAYGWAEDNRIGSLHQANPWTEDWSEFWRDARLLPHVRASFDQGGLGSRDHVWVDAVLDRVEEALAPVSEDPPQLIHGDLWSGNVHPGPVGRPVLIDPATCYGRGEVDLAMAQLFSGFSPATFEAYGPLAPGWAEVRRPLYQLYYLLVHLRLFGASYYRGTRSAAEQVVAALG